MMWLLIQLLALMALRREREIVQTQPQGRCMMATKKTKGYTKVTHWGDVKAEFDGGAAGCTVMLFDLLPLAVKQIVAAKIATSLAAAETKAAKDGE